jgi:predicted patatin/cPLA2 family phospholipase
MKFGRPLTDGYISASLAVENARKQGGMRALALIAKGQQQKKKSTQMWQMYYRYGLQVQKHMEEMREFYEGRSGEADDVEAT